MNIVYRFRIYPNKSQKELFARTFGCVRFVYNRMLAEKIEYYEKTGKVYLLEKSQLNILDNTRELNEKEYKQAYSSLKIDYLKPYNKIEQLKTKKYKEIYMDVAYNVSNEIIANTYRKLV